MTGISAIGAYIPAYRLLRSTTMEQWGAGGGLGERSVANHDEDTTTLAVSAALDLIAARGRDGIDALFFASTTPTYREKMTAPLIAASIVGTLPVIPVHLSPASTFGRGSVGQAIPSLN